MDRNVAYFVIAWLVCGAVSLRAELTDLAAEPTWHQPTFAEAEAQVTAWLDRRQADTQVRQDVARHWAEESDNLDVLQRVVLSVSEIEPRAGELAAALAVPAPDLQPFPEEPKWLWESDLDRFVANNLRLLCARSYVQEQYYDEALHFLEGLGVEDVVDPAALLFYRGVVYHRLLMRDEGLDSLERLLENKDVLPERYVVLAGLMTRDLKQLKDDSLDHISRRMGDIHGRLAKGRATEKVRQIEDGVIESLDKLIKEMEDQMSQSSSMASGGAQSNKPAQDSFPMGGKGEGRVSPKKIGNNSGWGDLPPKEREETLQRIGEDFPSHYREIIEDYFREIAKQLSQE